MNLREQLLKKEAINLLIFPLGSILFQINNL